MTSSTDVAWPAAVEIGGGSTSSYLLLILFGGFPKQNLNNVCFLDLHGSRDAEDILEKLKYVATCACLDGRGFVREQSHVHDAT